MAIRLNSVLELPPNLRAQAEQQMRPITSTQEKLAEAKQPPPQRERRSKYAAKPVVIDGIRFDSTAEGKRYQQLCVLRTGGVVSWFHRQVIFDLPGGVTYRCDFMIGWADGAITYEDVKGVALPTFKLKAKQVRALYNVEITIP